MGILGVEPGRLCRLVSFRKLIAVPITLPQLANAVGKYQDRLMPLLDQLFTVCALWRQKGLPFLSNEKEPSIATMP